MDTIIKNKGRSCQICNEKRAALLRPAVMARGPVVKMIKNDVGNWQEDGWICVEDLQKYRHKYVEELLTTERGELTDLDLEVMDSLRKQEIFAHNPEKEFDADLTLGQRLADRIADFGGSWAFISIFGAVFLLWMFMNSIFLINKPFDPYPYILLNLVLSCLAALQAPVIMMSQNRQEARDRMRAEHDYQVNLKAELEIRQLHQKIDHMLSHQWERMIEIQKIQMDLIDETRSKK